MTCAEAENAYALSVIECKQIDPVVASVQSGGSFRQIKKFGVRLVTIEKPE